MCAEYVSLHLPAPPRGCMVRAQPTGSGLHVVRPVVSELSGLGYRAPQGMVWAALSGRLAALQVFCYGY